MVRRRNRLVTDAAREVRFTFSRFLSILVLSALAVAFLAGLRAAAPDMEYTADNYYDRTNFMDGYVLSTLGLTGDDLAALKAADGVADVEGGWSVDAISVDAIVTVRSMPERLNLLTVENGRLPESADECVTENLLLIELGLEIGDTLALTMAPDNEGDLLRTEYTIVGTVASPLYVSSSRGSSSLGSGSVDAFVFIPGENFTYDYYTIAYLLGDGLQELDSYGDEYEDRLEALVDGLESLAEERAKLRYDTVIGDAQGELDDAQAELDDARAEAEQELDSAYQELTDARQELDDGWTQYRDGQRELDDAVAEGNRKITDGQQELDDALAELNDGERELTDALIKLNDAEQEAADARQELDDGWRELADARQELDDGWQAYYDGVQELEDAAAKAEQEISDAQQKLDEALAELNDGEGALTDARRKLDSGWRAYYAGVAEYENGLAEYQKGRQEYEDGLAAYEDGLAAYQEGLAEYEAASLQLSSALAQLEAGEQEYQQGKDQFERFVTRCLLPVTGFDTTDELVAALEAEDPDGPVHTTVNAALSALRAQISALKSLAAALDELEESQPELIDQISGLIEQIEDALAALDPDQEIPEAVKEAFGALLSWLTEWIDTALGEMDPGSEDLAALRAALEELQDLLVELDDVLDGIEWGDQDISWESIRAALDELEAMEDQIPADADEVVATYWMLVEARQELDNGWEEYNSGQARLQEAGEELAAARQELDEAERELADAKKQLEDAEEKLADGKAELVNAGVELTKGEAEYAAGRAELDDGWQAYYTGAAELDDARTAMEKEIAAARRELDDALAKLENGEAEYADALAKLENGEAEYADGMAELEDGWREYNDGMAEVDDGWRAYSDGVTELADARTTLKRETIKADRELADALKELENGETEYADGVRKYEEGKADADAEIADAQAKLNDARQELNEVEECEWYVLGRNTNVGFVGYSQDAERVSNLANIFPVIFFLVAALACLTTMTRMVEEQRTQIGSMKALGFSRLAISQKYLGYAFTASLLGGVIGLAVGGTLIPAVVANAFNIMYKIPKLEFKSQTLLCVLSVFAAVACTTGAALWACVSTLTDTPANLMRPKAPKAGRRVFLEYVKPLWSRLTFTWKVTMRNLFRYQRRFWMTVIGIGGCTALIVTGFGLHESIFDILDLQFDEISRYDATVGLEEDITEEELGAVEAYLAESGVVEDFLLGCQSAADASTDGISYSVTLSVVKDMEEFTRFIDLRHRKDDEAVTMPADGVIITEKLAELLEVKAGDTITIEGDRRVTVPVRDIVENYVYHYVYLTDSYYAQLFGGELQENVVMVRYQDEAGTSESDQVSAGLMQMDGVTSYSYIATIRDTFTDSMNAINYAVVIIIVAAAALAFVVLYNLTNINITERTRELATLKVLGFYDRETTAYVYRENIFLTAFGIILGLVLGRFLHAWMVVTVEVTIVMFGRTAPPYAYILAAVLTVVFSVVVNIAAHFKLKKVDMVESLKSVE